jgi:glyoxylase-like metal-dependent hydrolase (beta-lactamase superfamily II)
LIDSLEALGVAPDDVTDVVFTHAHPDHLWGLIDDFNDLMFPEASYMIGRAEWDYWMNPNTVDEIGEALASFAVGAQRRLAMIEDNVSFIDDGQEIIPGIAARATYGHTVGHMAFELSDGSNSAMIIGDCIGNHHVAFARPDWPSGSDQNRDTAIATRVSLLDQLNAAQMPLVGYHLPGGIGRVETKGGRYQFVSEI